MAKDILQEWELANANVQYAMVKEPKNVRIAMVKEQRNVLVAMEEAK